MNPFSQRLERSRHDKMLGGVASGIAHYLRVDPVLVRLAFVLLTLLMFGSGILVYLILWVVMPMQAADGTNQAFVAPGSSARRVRYDPMTGQSLEPGAAEEIPIPSLDSTAGRTSTDVQMRRGRFLGAILIGLGVVLILKHMLPAGALLLLPPLLLIGAGLFLLLYRRDKRSH